MTGLSPALVESGQHADAISPDDPAMFSMNAHCGSRSPHTPLCRELRAAATVEVGSRHD